MRCRLPRQRPSTETRSPLDQIRTTLKVAEEVSAASLYLEAAIAVADSMKALEEARIDPRLPERVGDVEDLVAQMQRLRTLRVDAPAAEAPATAVDLMGR